MSLLYADENFPFKVVRELRLLGHDVLTALQAGNAGKGIPDQDVLAYAISLSRAIVTNNRRHFIKLHKTSRTHAGIVVCTEDKDGAALAQRIHQQLVATADLSDKLIRVNKPVKP